MKRTSTEARLTTRPAKKARKPYVTDIVPTLRTYLGGDSGAHDLACLIVQFAGTVITDWRYAKFRAQSMSLINKHMANGYGGVDLIQGAMPYGFQYNETHALWLCNDLEAWGFSVRDWFRTRGDTYCFMSVGWGFSVFRDMQTPHSEMFEAICPKDQFDE